MAMDTLNILLVEDNEIDILITQEILNQERGLNILNSVTSAEEAILYLNKAAPFHCVEKPDLILLDINLPKSNGFVVLLEVKTNPDLRDIPVFILTSSTSDSDKEFALRNKADLYMEKPLDFNLMQEFFIERRNSSQMLSSI